jgi:hypothetical protein
MRDIAKPSANYLKRTAECFSRNTAVHPLSARSAESPKRQRTAAVHRALCREGILGFLPAEQTGAWERRREFEDFEAILKIAERSIQIMASAGKSFGKALPVLAVAFQTVGKRVEEPAGGFQTVGKGLLVLAGAFQRVGRAFPVRAGRFQAFGRGLPVLAVAFQTVGKRRAEPSEAFQSVGRRGDGLDFTDISFMSGDWPVWCPPFRVQRVAGRRGARGFCAAPRRGTLKRGHQTREAAGPAAPLSFPHLRTATLSPKSKPQN